MVLIRGCFWRTHLNKSARAEGPDSLGAEPIDSSNPLFTGGAGGGGLIFRFDPPPKRCFWLWQFAIFAYRYNIAQIPDSDPISGRNKGSTSQLGSNMAQRGHLSSTWHCQLKKRVSLVFSMFLWQPRSCTLSNVPYDDPTWCEAATKRLQVAPLDGQHGFDLGPSGSIWAFSPTWPMTSKDQLAPTWASLGAARARARPNQSEFAEPMRHAENVRFNCYYFQRCFTLMGGSCSVVFPTLGLSRAQLTMLRMLNPTCVQTCPRCAKLDPS